MEMEGIEPSSKETASKQNHKLSVVICTCLRSENYTEIFLRSVRDSCANQETSLVR